MLLMQSEPRWSKLEDEGAYLVLTPLRPFYMLWATKKWTQLMGTCVCFVLFVNNCVVYTFDRDLRVLDSHNTHIFLIIIRVLLKFFFALI